MKESARREVLEGGDRRGSLGAYEQTFDTGQLAHRVEDFGIGDRHCSSRNMKIINDIVEMLWQAKTHRQVIFASHNANFVVNGDAEFIICCDYRTTATESCGQIKCTDAIDVPEINCEIAEVMEGGIEAFKLRYQKYGLIPVGLPQPEAAAAEPADVK